MLAPGSFQARSLYGLNRINYELGMEQVLYCSLPGKFKLCQINGWTIKTNGQGSESSRQEEKIK
jgi:hypothetical protein